MKLYRALSVFLLASIVLPLAAIAQQTGSTGSASPTAISTQQPTVELRYMIAYQGVFPTVVGGTTGEDTPMIGEIRVFSADFLPQGWLACDGAVVNTATYGPLGAILGNAFGGDGVTTFALPDMRGRVPVGTSATRPLGSVSGASSVTLDGTTLPSHAHTTTDGATGVTGGSAPISLRQPSLALTHLICIAGVSNYMGEVRLFAGDFAPGSWDICDGEIVTVASNPMLFSILGTNFGGNGTTNFALPDFRDRSILAYGLGAGLTDRPFASVLGQESVTLTAANLPPHVHTTADLDTGSTGSAEAVSLMQPSLAITAAVATAGIFPSELSYPDGVFIAEIRFFAFNHTRLSNALADLWLPLDGSLQSIATYTDLFILIGITYGGDGVSTFALPNMTGRLAQGLTASPVPGNLTGNETVVLSSAQMPAHTHALDEVEGIAVVGGPLGDALSGGEAPGSDGATSIGTYSQIRRGGSMAENGYLVFPGLLEVDVAAPVVTAATSSGLWKQGAGDLFLMARSGTTVPDLPGTQFATALPDVPGISDEGEVSFLGSLVVGAGGVTADNDTGLWSELGGGLSLLLREDDAVPGLAGVRVGKFASGIYATATTSPTTGEAVFPVTYRGSSTATALLRSSISGSTVTVSVVAQEGTAAPGTAGTFANIAGSYTDPPRMDAQGNVIFAALTTPGSKEGIWYQTVAGGTPSKVFFSGETAPGTGGATFNRLQRPSIGSNGFITFRASLNLNGDNVTNTRNDGIWAGNAATPGTITCVLRRGDGIGVVSNLPVGALVGNPWGGWLSNSNLGAWKGWLDVNGDGTSAAPTDVHAIYTNLSGAMQMALSVGDAAPGTTGATFSGFDLPMVGGNNQYAILGNLTGGDTVAGNNQGLWRSDANGGPLTLLLRKGDSVTTTEGSKVVTKIDVPGSNQTDRRWEQPVMDNTGRMVVHVTFSDGSTSQVIVP